MLIDLFTKPLQSQATIIKFVKTLVKFISESHTDEITYVRLVADERNDIQHYRKSLTSWNDIYIDRLILIWLLARRSILIKVWIN